VLSPYIVRSSAAQVPLKHAGSQWLEDELGEAMVASTGSRPAMRGDAMTATMTKTRSVAVKPDGRFEIQRAASPRRSAILAVVGGLVLLASSTGLALAERSGPTARRSGPVNTEVVRPVAALPNIGTASETYEPGHTSGWHVHPGVHSVVVLSGMLTIYDEHCVRTDYGPGEIYLGGNAPHLARNEGTDDLNVAITYVYSSTSQTPGSPVAGPAGCGVR
jgi:quercetin dioxygenase-like cupin family protein